MRFLADINEHKPHYEAKLSIYSPLLMFLVLQLPNLVNIDLQISYLFTIYVVNRKARCVYATFILGKCGETGIKRSMRNRSILPSLTVSE